MPQDRFDYYPLAQAKEEARMVRERGQVPVDSAAASPDDLSTIQDSQGLALSGGGIRSEGVAWLIRFHNLLSSGFPATTAGPGTSSRKLAMRDPLSGPWQW